MVIRTSLVPTNNRNLIRNNFELKSQSYSITDWLLFLLPVVIWIEIKIIGRIFLPELILAAFLPFLLFTQGKKLFSPLPKTILFLGFLWLLAQISTDLIRSTPFEDYTRGWAKITFTLINFAALYILLYGNWRRIILFVAGLIIGDYLTYFIVPSEFAFNHPWKFGTATPTTLLVVLIASHSRIYRIPFLPILLMVGIGIINLYMGFRSYGGILFISALYLFLQTWNKSESGKTLNTSFGRFLFFSLFILFAAIAVLKIYELAVTEGWLGEQARKHYEYQSAGEFGVLLGGRSELIVSSRAILNSPIIGHGSWAKDPYYRNLLLDLRYYGYNIISEAVEKSDLIPTHSLLFGAWVEAGIIGSIFWFWVLFFIFRLLMRFYTVHTALSPLIVFIALSFTWDIFFSPFGAERRILVGYYFIILFFTWDTLMLLATNYKSERYRNYLINK